MKRITIIVIGLIILAACGTPSKVDNSDLTCMDLKNGLVARLSKLNVFMDLGFEDSIPAANQKIVSLLKQIAITQGLENCDLSFDMMTYVSSDDRRLKFVSWDTKKGGTMIEFATVAVFQDKDSLKVELLLNEFGENLFENFDGIHTLQNDKGETLYLVKAYGIGSSVVRHLSLKVFQLKDRLIPVSIFPGGQSEITMGYEAHSQDTLVDIEVLEQGKKIRVPIVDGDSLTGDYEEFNFNGATFVSPQQKNNQD